MKDERKVSHTTEILLVTPHEVAMLLSLLDNDKYSALTEQLERIAESEWYRTPNAWDEERNAV